MTKSLNPFQFAPVAKDEFLTTPVQHDAPFARIGEPAEQALLSGRIQFSLYGLTPLLVGNERKDADFGGSEVSPLSVDGDYLISMHSLRGMLRSMVASLYGDRMERVGEAQWMIRPSLDPDLKEGVLEQDGSLNWWIRPLKKPKSTKNEHEADVLAAQIGGEVSRIGFGADGLGVLARAHDKAREEAGETLEEPLDLASPRGIWMVFRRDKGDRLEISSDLFQQYDATTTLIQQLVSAHPLRRHIDDVLAKSGMQSVDLTNSIRDHRRLEPGKCVYYETSERRLVSFGRSFRYKWACRDTTTKIGLFKTKVGARRRAELGYGDDEKAAWFLEPKGSTPTQWENRPMKAVNALFGFSARGEWLPSKAEERSSSALEQGYKGRVQPSHALYAGAQGCIDRKGAILQILAQPKPLNPSNTLAHVDSDVERNFGVDGFECGDLAGRKHYLHHPRTTFDSRHYALEDKTKGGSQHSRFTVLFRPKVTGQTIASLPVFRGTLHFDSLRRSELALVLLALDLGNSLHGQDEQKVLDRVRSSWSSGDLHAHKIGGGRPLGLGSCLMVADRIEIVRARAPTSAESTFPTLEVEQWGTDKMKLLAAEAWDVLGVGERKWPCTGRLNALRLITRFVDPPRGVRFGYPIMDDDPLLFWKTRREHEAKARHGKHTPGVRESALDVIADKEQLPVVVSPPSSKAK